MRIVRKRFLLPRREFVSVRALHGRVLLGEIYGNRVHGVQSRLLFDEHRTEPVHALLAGIVHAIIRGAGLSPVRGEPNDHGGWFEELQRDR